MALSSFTALYRAQGKEQGQKERERAQAGTFCGGKRILEGDEKQWGAGCHKPTPSRHRHREAGPGGSDLTVGGRHPSSGQPSHVRWAVTQQV